MGAVGLQTQFAIRGHCGGEFNPSISFGVWCQPHTCRDPVPPDVFEPRISQARGLCVHKMVAALLSARRCDRHRDYIANVSATKGWPRIPGCEQREGGGRHAALRPPVQGALCRHRHRTSGYRYVRTACDHANTPGTSTRRGFGEIEERSNGNQPPQPHVSGRNAEKNGGMHAVSK
jgi:hypothetical protein